MLPCREDVDVRELHHAIERAFVLADSNVEIEAEELLMHAESL